MTATSTSDDSKATQKFIPKFSIRVKSKSSKVNSNLSDLDLGWNEKASRKMDGV